MFQSFINSKALQLIFRFCLGIFVALVVYHIIRFYIVKPDCGYVTSTLNQNLEMSIFLVGIVGLVLSLILCIGKMIHGTQMESFVLAMIFIAILLTGRKILDNIILECMFTDKISSSVDGLLLFTYCPF